MDDERKEKPGKSHPILGSPDGLQISSQASQDFLEGSSTGDKVRVLDWTSTLQKGLLSI
ncbi:MAG: hypothetical protein JRJ65_01000 [Deltaproteobacteria bacterium]|nr:hypothetical protein [Deltaproteobacteria bacterium]